MKTPTPGTAILTMLVCLVTIGTSGCGKQAAVIGQGNEVQAEAASPDKETGKDTEGKGNPGTGFVFPPDSDSLFRDRLVPPADKTTLEQPNQRLVPRPMPTPRYLERPELPVPAVSPELPSLPLPTSAVAVRPHPLAEEPPLSRSFELPVAPGAEELPAGARVRLPGVDIDQPVPLPLLGQQQPEPLAGMDPTAEFSQAAALAAPLPDRVNPAPFLRLNLPDPFEHSHTVQLRQPPVEDSTPSASAQRPPRP